MLYRGKGSRTTDGDKVWQGGDAREFVSSPLSYKPPEDPLKAIEPGPEALEGGRRVDALMAWLFVSAALLSIGAFALVGVGIIRLLLRFAFGW